MHGRIKVKTTAEQQEAKRKEREKKLKIYNAGTEAVFQKRKNKEFDEEGLKLSGELLGVNPDIYSFWNFRREIFIDLQDKREEAELQKLLQDELHFLEACLKVNPKSYGAWHHRCFVMDAIPEPDWGRELHLCNTFLNLDERNFHCWDYRRHVVLRSNVNLDEELQYTTQKIQSNFSNYSSWHYRSKLLPVIHPDSSHPVAVQEDVLLKEFEVVQNAVFTDPDDQSAWFYQRWLLGRGQKKLQICCVHVSRDLQRIVVLLSRPVMMGQGHCLTVSIDTTPVAGKWRTITGSRMYSTLWVIDLPDQSLPVDKQASIAVTLMDDRYCTKFSEGLQLMPDQEETWAVAEFKQGSRFSTELSAAATSTMAQELESIRELQSLEPNNKWVLLTMIHLMKAIDPEHTKYAAELEESFNKLAAVDTMRKSYYWDLRSKFLIESVLESHDSKVRDVKLCQRGLSCLYHTDWMVLVTSIDLSQNYLKSVRSLSDLQCLRSLNLDNNQLADLQGLAFCRRLTDLSVKNNSICNVEVFEELRTCVFLKKLSVAGNPVCAIEDNVTKICALNKSLQVVDEQDSIG
ncbi:geranylgeranyl transferase type-2 subunit alpha-like [Mizuhopecten yessoensis]|uniref:geranylgeranyl transferase type-2 subunit alpha-like n=1 Tax=Mizuhopecten yessoensis TaxID=6573 RepID=UPI000B45F8BC|nr:geranylgeranyl transferase type-2 subunit alpha-like [Mizuhopecten yessoensis]